ncbi:hypothetical protein [Haladaptatus halobius]|uniref:hypothetical protein n=1 Tax=Haladaptatus halobius TaxID=2884875 RepID=UPI001D0B4FAE|nr:hypothetical protein [Haladaptatus halobius]
MDSVGDHSPTIGISVFVDPCPPLTKNLFDRLIHRLRSWATVHILRPDTTHPNLSSMELDLYHMAHWHHAAIQDLKRASQNGAATINSYQGVSVTTDRLAKLRRLQEAGITVPEFQFGTDDEITLNPPVLVKPRNELDFHGHEFDSLFTDDYIFDGEKVVQRYIVPRQSYKVFRIGEAIRTAKHHWKDGTSLERPTSRNFRQLTRRVADVFDLSLFELDIVVHKAAYVIDVNPVVSLEGISDAVQLYETCLREAISH